MVNNKSYYILILSLLIFSCESADLSSVEKKIGRLDKKFSGVEKKLNSILESQELVLNKINKIEKDQNALQKGIAELKKTEPSKKDNKKQQPPKADPNKVYDIAIGNSIVLGKKDAPVTIIEWTDFQ